MLGLWGFEEMCWDFGVSWDVPRFKEAIEEMCWDFGVSWDVLGYSEVHDLRSFTVARGMYRYIHGIHMY